MKLALNGATIMHSPLADDVEIAAECGYSELEVWAGKLDTYLVDHTLEDLRARLHDRGIKPWCINSIENISYRDAAGRREVLAQLERTCEIARAIGAPSIVVVPGRRPDGFNRGESIVDAVDILRAMSDVAGDVGLAFEFLGKPGCSVPVVDMASEIVTTVDRANVGMVIDTFHFYAGGSRLDDLAHVPVDKLFVVHLNGCEDRPKGELTDAHRLYPGEGAIPITDILAALRKLGFDGVASIEIFRPEYWQLDPRIVARTARERAIDVLTSCGYTIDE
ncbi:MAG TPA: sugar phosphate isomerase/epimerase [Dehalococcoidia bacterium]